MKALPYGADRKSRDAARVDRFIGRKSGGRVTEDSGTNIHIEINAGKDEQAGMDVPGLGAPPPPMPPLPPPPMGGPGLGAPPPPLGGTGPIAGMKRGGRATSRAAETHRAKSDVADTRGIGLRRASGGRVGKDHGGPVTAGKPGPGIQMIEGGAGGGMGRLDKTADEKRDRKAGK